MDDATFKTLELDTLLDLLVRHVQTPLGRKQVLELRPTTERERIETDLDRTTECVEYLSSDQRFGFSGLGDPGAALALLEVEETRLDPQQILLLEHLVAVGVDLRNEFRNPELRNRFPALSKTVAPIPDLRRLQSLLQGKLLPTGEIDDRASPELRRIRREIQQARQLIHRHLETILQEQESAAQEELVTFRNGRFVIPVRTDARGRVAGVVHGLSSSGQTTYVEPLSVIERNNDWVRLRELEEIEIARILYELSEALRENLTGIRTAVAVVTELDMIQAKARLSSEFICTRPQIGDGAPLRLLDARHILLQASHRKGGGQVVPVSFSLDTEHHVLVISGPNAGGKTVVLKTTGLIALMAQMGLHVPAREALLPIYRQVFADIGDQQSIAANLSTFTAHLKNISDMAAALDPPSLLLLDEVGTGTDPDEGAALAVAIVDYFRRARVTTIATTHYNELKTWASQAPGVLNASVEFDSETLRPTYRLLVGIAGASCGLDIAEKLEVPPPILASARSLLDPSHVQAADYLKRLKAAVDQQESHRAALEEERKATADRYGSLERKFAERETSRRAEFERALTEALEEFRKECDRLVASVKDRVESARLKKHTDARASTLSRAATQLVERHFSAGHGASADATKTESFKTDRASGGEIHEGDPVRILSIDKNGIVESIRADVYSVQVGPIRYRARREELAPIAQAGSAADERARAYASVEAGALLDQTAPAELNVIGLNTDEASARVDKFLDTAFLSGIESVRIIHGHGTGALRRAIAQLLSGHSQVEAFRPAPPERGGGGVTIVDLKK